MNIRLSCVHFLLLKFFKTIEQGIVEEQLHHDTASVSILGDIYIQFMMQCTWKAPASPDCISETWCYWFEMQEGVFFLLLSSRASFSRHPNDTRWSASDVRTQYCSPWQFRRMWFFIRTVVVTHVLSIFECLSPEGLMHPDAKAHCP